jgi:hypothetical protein
MASPTSNGIMPTCAGGPPALRALKNAIRPIPADMTIMPANRRPPRRFRCDFRAGAICYRGSCSMERDDLDRFLSDDEIVPSSGFVVRVMDAVRVEAAAPPAIPFPWLRALPGIVTVVIALASMIAGVFRLAARSRKARFHQPRRSSPSLLVTWSHGCLS